MGQGCVLRGVSVVKIASNSETHRLGFTMIETIIQIVPRLPPGDQGCASREHAKVALCHDGCLYADTQADGFVWRGGKGREEGHLNSADGAVAPPVFACLAVPHAHPLRDATTVIAGAVRVTIL